MPWTERQRRLLAELGVPPWLAPGPQDATSSDAAPPTEAVSVPAAVPPTGLNPAAGPTPALAEVPAAPRPQAPPSPVLPAPAVALPGPAIPAVPMASAGAGATATDGLDWTQLRAAVAACTACGLCSGRTQTVFGVGHTEAAWMVVGEAPGEHEDRLGEPFVGKSGQLLDNMLRALGLSRSEGPAQRQVYIANAIKCRPPGNRNPTPEELARCEPFLLRQIALVRPKIILAMGRFAVQSLLRSHEPIGRLRGRLHHYQGVPLVVTYHPAYLLRNPEEKARAWDDLCLAAEVAEQAAAG